MKASLLRRLRRGVFARAAARLAPSQNVFEKLFVSNTPNKGINVMLMTLWPITAPLMDPSALENLFSPSATHVRAAI